MREPYRPKKYKCGNRAQREQILREAITRFTTRNRELQINIFSHRMQAGQVEEGEVEAVLDDWEAEEDEEAEDEAEEHEPAHCIQEVAPALVLPTRTVARCVAWAGEVVDQWPGDKAADELAERPPDGQDS